MTQINNSYIPQSFFNPETGKLNVDEKLAQQVSQSVDTALKEMPAAEKQVFLGMVANLTPEGLKTPEDIKATLAKLEEAAAKITAMTQGGPSSTPFMGNITELLGKLMIQQAADQREQALKDRLSARESAKAELLGQAQKMEDAAAQMKTGAITALVLGVVSSAVSVAGSLASAVGGIKQLKEMNSQMKSLQSANKALDSANNSMSELKNSMKTVGGQVGENADVKLQYKVDKASIKADQVGSGARATEASKKFDMAQVAAGKYSAAGQMINSAGDITKSIGSGVDASMQADAKATDAEGSRDAAQAQYDQQIADAKKEIGDQMNDMIKQIINFIKEMQDAEVDAMRAITRA